MTIILKILSSNNELDIIPHLLEVSQLLDVIERGSISMNTKYNSLLGRWFKEERLRLKLESYIGSYLFLRKHITSGL